ncbi:hypothetical protein ACFQRL_06115 [Microbacterium fluvii]|uniref:Uncharacterized protein n=1 Tax=Microbacterium fluvii TaxID=415215 RepID=A0ABW2HB09_9MICO|nr:hypothetical protein [Microbacterium fluvii]MCU4672161.1 hypothetical protein [Microbacterium fluvii]
MRDYLFGTGIVGAITSGLTLMRTMRGGAPFTWRAALAMISWLITLALAIGAIVDTRNARRGHSVAADSPVAEKQHKLAAKGARRHR